MLFSSPIFMFVFLPITILVYYFSNDRLKNIVLLIASLLFYAWGEPVFIFIMLLSIFLNYLFGILIHVMENHPVWKKIMLILALTVDLGILINYKYSAFLVESFNGFFHTNLTVPNVALPLGISFFTFQAMSYVIDVYRKDGDVQKNLFSLTLYISLFPELIAGPIVRYKDIDEQIRNRTCTHDKMVAGIQRFIIGISKKVLIASAMGKVVDSIYAVDINKWSSGMAWGVAICYTLQIYFDFSSYSDMAIGIAKIFGFELLENFNYPYISKSIKEFWRRWHISLSTWFRDYLYIPLGGNRCAVWRSYLNQFIVFFLCGLWHGASSNYVFWGVFYGCILVLERAFLSKFLERLPSFIRHIYAMLIVVIAWVFFRAATLSDAMLIIKKMFIISKPTAYSLWFYISPFAICMGVLGIIAATGLPVKIIKKFENVACFDIVRYVYLLFMLVISMAFLASGAYNPFIYFKF